jgi:hypothetical protein
MNLHIDRGNPTPEELAALVGVLAGWPVSTSEPPARGSAWWRSGLPTRRRDWRESGLPRLSSP